jgi:hypothetical protein
MDPACEEKREGRGGRGGRRRKRQLSGWFFSSAFFCFAMDCSAIRSCAVFPEYPRCCVLPSGVATSPSVPPEVLARRKRTHPQADAPATPARRRDTQLTRRQRRSLMDHTQSTRRFGLVFMSGRVAGTYGDLARAGGAGARAAGVGQVDATLLRANKAKVGVGYKHVSRRKRWASFPHPSIHGIFCPSSPRDRNCSCALGANPQIAPVNIHPSFRHTHTLLSPRRIVTHSCVRE